MIKLEQLKERLEGDLEYLVKAKKKFIEEFEKDAAYTLSWSTETFSKAAQERVIKSVLSLIEEGLAKEGVSNEEIMEVVSRVANAAVIKGAMYPARSTSPVSNIMATEELSAWANIVERINGNR